MHASIGVSPMNQTELDNYRTTLDDLVSNVRRLQTLRDIVTNAPQLSPSTSRLVTYEVLDVCRRSQLPVVGLSTESTDAAVANPQSLSDRINDLWQLIVETMKKALAALRKLVDRFTSSFTAGRQQAEAIIHTLNEPEAVWELPPPGVRYPYQDLTPDQLRVLAVNERIPSDWYHVVPLRILDLGRWLETMASKVIANESALFDTYKATLSKPEADWSAMETLVQNQLTALKTAAKNIPGLTDGDDLGWNGEVSPSTDKAVHVTEMLQAMRNCMVINRGTKPIENTVESVTVDQTLAALTASLKWPNPSNTELSKAMNTQLGLLERMFDFNKRTSWKQTELETAQQIGRLIPGNQYTALMPVWNYYISITVAFVRAVQVIQRTHQ